ncbi:MAG: NAD-dependent epimerase/dehydratase family protein [Chloroflexi bacterium]|nr:NAD-dependent epimerase/dehydratase family protein [Chloroflexota bacterium]
MKRILVTGAFGQIGAELTPALRERYGASNVIAAGHVSQPSAELRDAGPFAFLDVTDGRTVAEVVRAQRIDTIVHMAALLSAVGEQKPQVAWNVNMNGLHNVLEVARELELVQVFCPSSIAVFGPQTPRDGTPQETVLKPTTMYGVTKVAGELLGDYYVRRYGVDVRGVRYPGIISNKAMPGGGTTDYAVEIFYKAIERGRYTCFLRDDSMLPMMYMPDCIKATMDLMEADLGRLRHHADYNLAAFSFAPADLVAEIQKHLPTFTCDYAPDWRQAIADSWPRSIDDSAARDEWGWTPGVDLAAMTADMLAVLGRRHTEGRLYLSAQG